jgi:hypothetical protein
MLTWFVIALSSHRVATHQDRSFNDSFANHVACLSMAENLPDITAFGSVHSGSDWALSPGSCYDALAMSLERSSHLSGGFQVKHRTLGIYQGSAIDLAFWYPSSAMPEYGLCRFSTEEKAQAFIDFLCSPACAERMDPAELRIEPYDLAEHERLISEHPLSSAWENPI